MGINGANFRGSLPLAPSRTVMVFLIQVAQHTDANHHFLEFMSHW